MPLYGPKWPLAPGNHDTFELIQDLKEQINFYLRCLLLTSPGENISDYGYGVGIRRFLFQNYNTIGSLRAVVSSQINKYLPYITVSKIEINSMEDENLLSIQIFYSIPGDYNQIIFNLEIKPDTIVGFY